MIIILIIDAIVIWEFSLIVWVCVLGFPITSLDLDSIFYS